MRPLLVIRADAGSEMGCGHIFRCLAYAQAWKRSGGRVMYLIAEGAEGVRRRLQSEGVEIERLKVVAGSKRDAESTAATANKAWVLLDGYHFSSDYQAAVRGAGARLLAIDDAVEELHFHADIVLNYDSYADETMYRSRAPYSRLLLGARYAPIRREFVDNGSVRKVQPKIARKILVTCGGGDAINLTGRLLQALDRVRVERLDVRAVCGPANPHYELIRATARASRHRVSLHKSVSDMAREMAWAEVALTAGGVTAVELAFMRVPRIIFITADNQERAVLDLASKRKAIHAGWAGTAEESRVAQVVEDLIKDAAARRALAAAGRANVDGKGPERVVRAMRSATTEGSRPRRAPAHGRQ